MVTLSAALDFLVYLDAVGVRVTPAPASDRLRLAGPPGVLTDHLRAALEVHRSELRRLLAEMPSSGWPCTGGCVRRSLVTAEKVAYRCWACALRRQQEERANASSNG